MPTCNTPPDLSPRSTSSKVILPRTGSFDRVVESLPIGVYSNSPSFITGAVDQVAYTFKMMGGDSLDLEITDCSVYAAYEDAVLEYSKTVNLYQAKSTLGSFLGSATGSFGPDGQMLSGSALSGSNAALKFPRFTIAMARRVGDELAYEAGFGGTVPYFSASIDVIAGVQDYDLQNIISSSAALGGVDYANLINTSNGARIRVNKVWYKSPAAMWRFFGYYGGLTVVGNLSTYGQYADDSTFDVIPAWQNKLQAGAYETNLFTRASHYSFEIKNNKLRLYPIPAEAQKMWFEFSVDPSPVEEFEDAFGNVIGGSTSIHGVSNLNNLPYENIPFESINSMGKQWIRKWALANSKLTLAQIRGKLSTIPIPGNDVTLNWSMLESQAKDEMEKLKEELKLILEETTFDKIVEKEASIVEQAANVQRYVPKSIFVG